MLSVARRTVETKIARVGLGFAETVEEVVEEDAQRGVDEARYEEAHREPRLRLGEQKFPDEDDDALMEDEEGSGEGESCGGMFGV
jgi:hypothetical protein